MCLLLIVHIIAYHVSIVSFSYYLLLYACCQYVELRRVDRFTAIISVPTQTEPGEYTVSATDQEGALAHATFTVIDMTGPQGLPGEPGSGGGIT